MLPTPKEETLGAALRGLPLGTSLLRHWYTGRLFLIVDIYSLTKIGGTNVNRATIEPDSQSILYDEVQSGYIKLDWLPSLYSSH